MFDDYIFPTDPAHAPELATFIEFFNSQSRDDRRQGLMYLIRQATFKLDDIMPNASEDEREDAFQRCLEQHESLLQAA